MVVVFCTFQNKILLHQFTADSNQIFAHIAYCGVDTLSTVLCVIVLLYERVSILTVDIVKIRLNMSCSLFSHILAARVFSICFVCPTELNGFLVIARR